MRIIGAPDTLVDFHTGSRRQGTRQFSIDDRIARHVGRRRRFDEPRRVGAARPGRDLQASAASRSASPSPPVGPSPRQLSCHIVRVASKGIVYIRTVPSTASEAVRGVVERRCTETQHHKDAQGVAAASSAQSSRRAVDRTPSAPTKTEQVSVTPSTVSDQPSSEGDAVSFAPQRIVSGRSLSPGRLAASPRGRCVAAASRAPRPRRAAADRSPWTPSSAPVFASRDTCCRSASPRRARLAHTESVQSAAALLHRQAVPRLPRARVGVAFVDDTTNRAMLEGQR